MNELNQTRIPVLVLGKCPMPDAGIWSSRFGINCDATRVTGACLQTALNAALAKSDTLLLLGGFSREELPPLALLSEILAQYLQVEESQLACRLIGQEEGTGSGAVLYAKGIRVYVCSGARECQEEVLQELRAYMNPSPPQNLANAWLMSAQPIQKARQVPLRKSLKTQGIPRATELLSMVRNPFVIVLAAACLAFCIGGGYLIYYTAESGIQEARNRKVQALYREPVADSGDGASQPGSLGVLQELNSDCVGWLSIPGAEVDLPVMQGSDNTYYLTHDANKRKSRFGALFLDSGNEITSSGQSRNLSIYGHNTKSGAMFGQLERYRDLAFYQNNAVFQFDSLFARRQWVVFAVFITNANPVQDYGMVFEWREQAAAAPENIVAFAAALKQRSIIDTGVDVQPGDELLSLATCAYEIKDGRLIVFARALRPGEPTPDPARAKENPTPLYPAAWYVNYGGQKPNLAAEPS